MSRRIRQRRLTRLGFAADKLQNGLHGTNAGAKNGNAGGGGVGSISQTRALLAGLSGQVLSLHLLPLRLAGCCPGLLCSDDGSTLCIERLHLWCKGCGCLRKERGFEGGAMLPLEGTEVPLRAAMMPREMGAQKRPKDGVRATVRADAEEDSRPNGGLAEREELRLLRFYCCGFVRKRLPKEAEGPRGVQP